MNVRSLLCQALAVGLLGMDVGAGEPTASVAGASAAEQLASMEAQCATRTEPPAASNETSTLFERLGGQERIGVITREAVRLHRNNPVLSGVVRKYDPDYLADILARYLITATGGPRLYDGPPLAATHAHLGLTSAHLLASSVDFSQAMKNAGVNDRDIMDTMCLLAPLGKQIVRD